MSRSFEVTPAFVKGQLSAMSGEARPSRGRSRTDEEFFFGWLGGDYLRRRERDVDEPTDQPRGLFPQ